jgi:hypothetical protein
MTSRSMVCSARSSRPARSLTSSCSACVSTVSHLLGLRLEAAIVVDVTCLAGP